MVKSRVRGRAVLVPLTVAALSVSSVVVASGSWAAADVAPVGHVDGCDKDAVFGWTRDPDFVGSLSVHVYRDGPAGAGSIVTSAVAADASEPATGGPQQRFRIVHGQPPGTRLFVHTIGVDAAGNANGNNPTLTLSANPSTSECGVPGLDEDTKLPGQNCEPAFVVMDYGGIPGSAGAVSAAHCDSKVAGKVFSLFQDADYEIIPLDVNRLNSPVIAGGQELRSANHFRVNEKNDSVFVSDNRANTVNPRTIGAADSNVCNYGGVSPTRCGQIVQDNYAPSYVNQARDFYLLNIPCEKGDSGSAIVSQDGTRAVGIVSGRRIADKACIVSRMDRIFAGAMKLYQPPKLDAKYQLILKLDGQWYPIGVHSTRSRCADAIEAGDARKYQERGVEARCIPE